MLDVRARVASGTKRAVSGAHTTSTTRLGISMVSKNEALANAGRIDAALPVYFQIDNTKAHRVFRVFTLMPLAKVV